MKRSRWWTRPSSNGASLRSSVRAFVVSMCRFEVQRTECLSKQKVLTLQLQVTGPYRLYRDRTTAVRLRLAYCPVTLGVCTRMTISILCWPCRTPSSRRLTRSPPAIGRSATAAPEWQLEGTTYLHLVTQAGMPDERNAGERGPGPSSPRHAPAEWPGAALRPGRAASETAASVTTRPPL
jgi:hypothetical protein